MSIKKVFSLLLCACMILTLCAGIVGCNSDTDGTETTDNSTQNTSPKPTEATTQSTTQATTTTKPTSKPSGGQDGDTENETNTEQGAVNDMDLVRYDLNKYLYPVWKTDVSYAEASFVRENANGVVEPLQLLYPVKNIVSVRSSDLKTLYTEGVDYNVTSDGKIEIIRTGSIPVLKYSDYYKPNYSAVEDNLATVFPAADPNDKGGFIRAEVGDNNPGMGRWTIAITYEHEGESVVNTPDDKSDKFATLIGKLEAGEDIKVVSMGDSITYGWSSTAIRDVEPFCPSYNRMVCKWIERKYNVNVNHVNIAVSGSGSGSGQNNGRNKVSEACAQNPDLVFVAYGMNDGVNTVSETYVSNINYIVSEIERNCPNACIVVVGTAIPNPEVGYSAGTSLLQHHLQYAIGLANAEKNVWSRAAFADVTTANVELLERKVYQDVAGSNSNHPNDYMHRIYAQVVLYTIFGEYV